MTLSAFDPLRILLASFLIVQCIWALHTKSYHYIRHEFKLGASKTESTENIGFDVVYDLS